MAYGKSTLATLKCPKSIDFINELLREPTRKLLKCKLQARYREAAKRSLPSSATSLGVQPDDQ